MSDHLRKLCAVFLLLLIVSPFTAPFSICSIAELGIQHNDGDGATLSLPPLQVSALDEAKSIVHVAHAASTPLAPPPDLYRSVAIARSHIADPRTPLVLRI